MQLKDNPRQMTLWFVFHSDSSSGASDKPLEEEWSGCVQTLARTIIKESI